MLLLSAIFAAVIFTTVATMVGGKRERTAAIARKRVPVELDAYDAPTLPLHRTMGLGGR
ncbi:hypothetical protein [Silvibacterium acidisoli]|uniref:hypothetical protein n=1 Tax=Acidobacteriaceae bacterium ZG23-2 TaxID=2883246 RepID=UPI00406CE3E6